jgi:putative autotransporter adhesin-like protein
VRRNPTTFEDVGAHADAIGSGMVKMGIGRASLLLLALLLSPGCVDIVEGNGVLKEEVRDARGFDQVNARGGLDVTINEGDFAVTVRIDENLLSYVRTSVADDTLTIAVDDANIREKLPGPHVVISMPALSDAETTGDGTLTATDFDAEAPVSLELTGDGELSWSGSATDLDAVLAGDGKLSIEGSAENTELFLRGSGTLDARDLVSDEASIVLDGPGALSITVNGLVNARAANGGTVDLFGRVQLGELDEATGATITTH